MQRYLTFIVILIVGALFGVAFQQLRIDEQKVFWQNTLIRYNIMTAAYSDICLPLAELESAVSAIGLPPEAITQSNDPRNGLVFVQTGSVRPFTKDLGNMKFDFDATNRCITVRQGD